METINDKFAKKTKYDTVKETKFENYKLINKQFEGSDCTVLVGDSLVEIYNPEFFYDYTKTTGNYVFNRGISGDTSNRMYERLMDNVINLKPKNIVIEIGTNDLGIGAPVEFTFCNIEKSINLIKETLPQTNIILQSIYPVNKSLSFISMVGRRDNETIKDINSRLERLSQSNLFTFLDLTEILIDKKGRLSKEYTYDGLHLNAKGFEVVSESILKLLK